MICFHDSSDTLERHSPSTHEANVRRLPDTTSWQDLRWNYLLPEIHEKIFSYLENPDLYTCLRVNKTWSCHASHRIFENVSITGPFELHSYLQTFKSRVKSSTRRSQRPKPHSLIFSEFPSENDVYEAKAQDPDGSVDHLWMTWILLAKVFRCTQLKRLVLRNSVSVAKDTFSEFISVFTGLEHIEIDHCPGLSVSSLAKLSDCSPLKSLILRKWSGQFQIEITSATLEELYIDRKATAEQDHLVLDCPRLKKLTLSNLALTGWMLSTSLSNSGKHLEHLCIIGRSYKYRISEDAFSCIPVYCNQLESFHLEFCDVPDSTLAAVAKACRQSLRHIKLIQVCGVMDTSITAIGKYCRKRLETLIIHDKKSISLYSQESLCTLLKSCKRLSKLHLCGNRSLSDVVLDALESSPLTQSLRELRFDMFDHISLERLDRLVERFSSWPRLETARFVFSRRGDLFYQKDVVS